MPKPALVTDPARSALMRRVRQKRTAPEEAVAAMLRRAGAGYRRNVRGLPGSPDFANRTRGWAIFVMGCFWHGHTDCRMATVPKRNRDFWLDKLQANRRRDARKIRALRAMAMRVCLVWECQLTSSAEQVETRIRGILDPRRPFRSRAEAARDSAIGA
ncbi:MAG TPA: very short patch repair endonuclease [Geminicoccaceae bacterium]|nr:very short patch repair endonuclease [Geminicoccus sp.]HMU48170.1 very short patch repair endonuclease [Geminicoccaceae bacterium]